MDKWTTVDQDEWGSVDLLTALAVTCELTGTQLSEGAAKVLAADLAPYPPEQVLGALTRCRKELRGRLTLADIISRLDDGRPGPEEAWAMLPRDEAQSVVWTEEMCRAWGVALPLLEAGEPVPARMAFLERYRSLVQTARERAVAVRWTASLGTDVLGRERALSEAERLGRLPAAYVQAMLPHRDSAVPVLKQIAERSGHSYDEFNDRFLQ